MKPALWALLAASLVATGRLALLPEPEPDPSDALLPTRDQPAPGRRHLPDPARTAAEPPPGTPAGSADANPPALATRPADWPAPGAAALAAWQGTPPPPAAATGASITASAPSRPATPFPYQWIGQLDDGGVPQVLLASAQRSVSVRLGEVLDNRWRIEQAADGALRATVLASGEVLLLRGRAPAGAP